MTDLLRRIRDIKDTVGIETVISECGGHMANTSWGEWQRTWCPFHDDHNASAGTNPVAGRFICHACGVRGDIIDLAKIHLGTESITEALEWLEEL